MAERTILITGAGGFLGGHVLRGLAERAEVSTVALARRPLTDPPGRVVQAVAPLAELTGETWSRLGVGRFDTAIRSPAAPTTPYATAKLECERLVAGTGDGWEPVILRCGQLYGPGDEEHAKLVPHTTRRLLSGLPPVVLGDGRAQRDLLYVADAAEAVVRAALAPSVPGVVNVVAGRSHPVDHIVATLSEIIGYRGPVHREQPERDSPSQRFDNRLLREALGTEEPLSLDDGLRAEVAHMKGLDR